MAEEATWSTAAAAASSAVDSDSEDAAVAAAWDDGKGPAVVPVFRACGKAVTDPACMMTLVGLLNIPTSGPNSTPRAPHTPMHNKVTFPEGVDERPRNGWDGRSECDCEIGLRGPSHSDGMEGGEAAVPCQPRDEFVRFAQVHLSLHPPLSFPHPTLLPATPFIIAVTPGLTLFVTSFRDCPCLARDAMMP